MYCPRCGRPVSDKAKFCGGCGMPKAEIIRLNSIVNSKITEQNMPVNHYTTSYDSLQTNDTPTANETENLVTEMENFQEKINGGENGADIFEKEFDEAYSEIKKTEAADIELNIAPDDCNTESTDTQAESIPSDENTANPEYTQYTSPQPTQSTQYTSAPKQTQGSYQSSAPVYKKVEKEYDATPMTTSDYLLMNIMALIPVIGLVFLVYTTLMSNNINKVNYAKATLITIVFVCIAVLLFFAGVFFRSFYWLFR